MKYDSNGTKKECTVWVHPSETSAYALNQLLAEDKIIIYFSISAKIILQYSSSAGISSFTIPQIISGSIVP